MGRDWPVKPVIHSLSIFRAVQSFDLMPLAPGTRLGPYEIIAPMGAGGMGEVYKARDTRLDRMSRSRFPTNSFPSASSAKPAPSRR